MPAKALILAAASLCALGAQAQCVAPRRLRAGAARDLQAATTAAVECSSALDLVYVLDSSGSIGFRPFDNVRKFINETLAAFDFDEGRVRASESPAARPNARV